MMLDVREVAKIFAVSEKIVYQWIARNEIPAYKIGEGYRFNRVELLEWANAKKMPMSQDIFNETAEIDDDMPSLTHAITAGGIHFQIPGDNKTDALHAIVNQIPFKEDIDRVSLAEALLAREHLASTAIGDGVAIPHVRNPIVFGVNTPVVALCFLAQPIDFGALDGKPVHTVFTIITHTVRSHLHLLSRLSFALHQAEIRSIIHGGSSPEDILDALRRFETTLNAQPPVS